MRFLKNMSRWLLDFGFNHCAFKDTMHTQFLMHDSVTVEKIQGVKKYAVAKKNPQPVQTVRHKFASSLPSIAPGKLDIKKSLPAIF